MIATRETLLKPVSLDTKEANIDGLGKVRMQQLSKSKMSQFQMWLNPKGKPDRERTLNRDLKLITMCVVDESGNTILTEDDFDKLSEHPGKVIDDLSFEVMAINGFVVNTDEDDNSLLGKSDN